MQANPWLLIGILIIIVGFALKFDSIAVVLVAAIVTALIGGLSPLEILEQIGKNFVSARVASLFILTLPIVGVCERYGLKEQAVKMIQSMKTLTAGRVAIVYQLIRELASAASLRLGGHPQFVRPLIAPMAEGAARKQADLDDDDLDVIKGATSAADNYGNFFAQSLFPASAGVILIVNTLKTLDINVTGTSISLWSIPIAVIVFILGAIQHTVMLDLRFKRKGRKES